MKRFTFIFLVASMTAVVFAECPSFCKSIELKNGVVIIGEIIQETDDAIVISKHGGSFIYSITRDRVKNIRESTADEIQREKDLSLNTDGDVRDKKRAEESIWKKRLREYRLEQYKKEVKSARRARGRIKIKFVENRFGVVDVVLNDKLTVPMLADTGASLVVISKEIAEKLAIKGLDERRRITAILADGTVTNAIPITLDSVQVGSSRVEDVDAAVTSMPPASDVDGLLGMSFLRHFRVKMDAKERSLILERY